MKTRVATNRTLRRSPVKRARVDERVEAAEHRVIDAGATFSDVTRATYRDLLEADKALTAYDLIDSVQTALGKRLHPPTIYRSLGVLQDHGLVHRLESANTYFPCSGPDSPHDHIHFLCDQCGAVEEVVDHSVADIVSRVARRQGFMPGRPVVEVKGVCKDCRKS